MKINTAETITRSGEKCYTLYLLGTVSVGHWKEFWLAQPQFAYVEIGLLK